MPGLDGRNFPKGRQIIFLMQVVFIKMLLNLFKRKGRAVVVEVLLDLTPVPESPEFESRCEDNFIHHVPIAIGEGVPEGLSDIILLGEVLEVGEASHAVVVTFSNEENIAGNVEFTLRAEDSEIGFFDDLAMG
jgi:hypothetical protein